jgi:hypothetical protein
MGWIDGDGVGGRYRRDVVLVASSAVLGPPIGGLALGFILAFQMRGPQDPIAVLAIGIGAGVVFAIFSHIAGLIPALVASAAFSVASRHVSNVWTRLALAPVLGAAATATWLFLTDGFGRRPPSLEEAWPMMAPMILAGAVPGFLVAAFVERFGPPIDGDELRGLRTAPSKGTARRSSG